MTVPVTRHDVAGGSHGLTTSKKCAPDGQAAVVAAFCAAVAAWVHGLKDMNATLRAGKREPISKAKAGDIPASKAKGQSAAAAKMGFAKGKASRRASRGGAGKGTVAGRKDTQSGGRSKRRKTSSRWVGL
jgi:hypothetical protein